MNCKYCRTKEAILDTEEWSIGILERPYKGDMVLDVLYNADDGNQFDALIEINYCPMCGKKLR